MKTIFYEKKNVCLPVRIKYKSLFSLAQNIDLIRYKCSWYSSKWPDVVWTQKCVLIAPCITISMQNETCPVQKLSSTTCNDQPTTIWAYLQSIKRPEVAHFRHSSFPEQSKWNDYVYSLSHFECVLIKKKQISTKRITF